MRRTLIAFYVLAAALMVGCNGTDRRDSRHQATDTIYTQQAAMSIYAYLPERALRIIDSAIIVGNMSKWRADLLRTRIYSSTQMPNQVDSLLGGPAGVRYDSARAIGERLLRHDSVKAGRKWQLDVLEMLAYTARMQNDTAGWLQRSREFVDICHQLGDSQETNALRTEAEIGAALYAMGQHEQGMAKLDSAIYMLNASFSQKQDRGKFAELDALIIALKRKIFQLSSHDKYAETLPLARLIIERLDDYKQHPDDYHDGTYREPKNDQKRADYILFYQNQAHSYITEAYASLGEKSNMRDAFEEIGQSMREATTREHIANYNALQQRIEAERQQAITHKAKVTVVIISIFMLLVITLTVVVIVKNRDISRKNRQLAQQIADSVNYKKMYFEEKWANESLVVSDLNALSDEQLFRHINDIIVREKLFLNPSFGRQTIMDRFELSKERVGSIFTKGSEFAKMTNYVQQLRMEYAAKLLIDHPEMSIVQIANGSGFGSHTYFSSIFRQYYGISPTDYRRNAVGSVGYSK